MVEKKPREVCETCHYFRRVEAGQGECRRYPPKTHIILASHPVTGELASQARVMFTRVQVDWVCGEFAPAPLQIVS